MTEQSNETTTPTVYEALAAVMRDIQGVAKGDRNEHQKFMFRGIDAVMNAVGPVLRKHGMIVVPNVTKVDYEKVHTTQNKPATACRVLVDYIFWGPGGDSIVTTVAGEAWDSGDKATPKAMSVAFRTALLQSLCLPTDEPDPDSHTYEQATEPSASGEQMAALTAAIREQGLGGEENSDARKALFADVLKRDTNGGDLLAREIDPVLKALAERGPTKAQEQMLQESLGAQPVEQPS